MTTTIAWAPGWVRFDRYDDGLPVTLNTEHIVGVYAKMEREPPEEHDANKTYLMVVSGGVVVVRGNVASIEAIVLSAQQALWYGNTPVARTQELRSEDVYPKTCACGKSSAYWCECSSEARRRPEQGAEDPNHPDFDHRDGMKFPIQPGRTDRT